MNIITVRERKRGCGYRKPGALYLRTDGLGRECGALPIELTVCPTCQHGIKPARAPWTWINLAKFAEKRGCDKPDGCGNCPIADAKIQMAGLIWIGKQYYKTPADFTREAQEMGLSRKINSIPKDFKLGETWVCIAHRKAISVLEVGKEPQFKPGIFHVFRPSRIEYCVKEGDSQEKLERMEKRGITLVKVERTEEMQPSLV